jgi:pSer/pThr/pTyr-binding forkhead associated (FHA) protein
MAKIIVTMNSKEVSEIILKKKVSTIGRDTDNDVYLKNPSVSRKHSQITKQGKAFYIEDTGSTNGTFVNGGKVNWKTGLNDNDKIAVGKYILIFREKSKEKEGKSQKIMPEFLQTTIKRKNK